jgi:hypothetical protein
VEVERTTLSPIILEDEARWVVERQVGSFRGATGSDDEWIPAWKSKLYGEVTGAKIARSNMTLGGSRTRLRKYVPVAGSERDESV